MTTPSGHALAGMHEVFAEFERYIHRDRVRAGIAEARKVGKPHGRPATIAQHSPGIQGMFRHGLSKRHIAGQLGISRSSVRRMLAAVRPRMVTARGYAA